MEAVSFVGIQNINEIINAHAIPNTTANKTKSMVSKSDLYLIQINKL